MKRHNFKKGDIVELREDYFKIKAGKILTVKNLLRNTLEFDESSFTEEEKSGFGEAKVKGIYAFRFKLVEKYNPTVLPINVEEKVSHYNTDNGFEASDIMDMIKLPDGLTGSQKHSAYNLIKRIVRFGKKDDIEVEAKKISEEFNKLITGKYR